MDQLALLENEMLEMTAALRAADPEAAVASCPGWTVRELAAHITGVHRWACAALDSDTPPAYDETPSDDFATAYADVAHALLTRLNEVPADHPCWTFDKTNPTASFWRRRQTVELAVHLWDAAACEVSDEVAIDGLDEVFDFFLPRQVHLGRTTLPDGTLTLASPGKTWTLGEGADETVVEGSPGDLLLAVYQRGTPLPGAWGETRLTP